MATEGQTERSQLLGGYFAERVVNSYIYESTPARPRAALLRISELLSRTIWEAGCYADSSPTETLYNLLKEGITLQMRLLCDLGLPEDEGGKFDGV